MSKKRILTGDRPTGRLHIGHYVGSLKRRVELQNSGEINMLDYINGCKLTGLTKEEYVNIIHNYKAYREKFNI